MRKISALVSSMVLLIVMAGCNHSVQGASNEISEDSAIQAGKQLGSLNEEKEIVASVNSTSDRIVNYDSLEKLIDASEIVVQGRVLETYSYVSGPGVVTEYKLEVSDSFYGKNESGSIITLISAGGIVPYTEAEKKLNIPNNDFENDLTEEKKKNGYFKYVFMGSPLIEKNQEYIIFAKKEIVDENKQLYGALGASQGQFNVETDKVKHLTSFGSSDETEWEKDQFISELKEKVKWKKG